MRWYGTLRTSFRSIRSQKMRSDSRRQGCGSCRAALELGVCFFEGRPMYVYIPDKRREKAPSVAPQRHELVVRRCAAVTYLADTWQLPIVICPTQDLTR